MINYAAALVDVLRALGDDLGQGLPHSAVGDDEAAVECRQEYQNILADLELDGACLSSLTPSARPVSDL